MSEKTLYRIVEQRIVEMIEGGLIRPGEKLPSLRETSRRMGVSLSTVCQAYWNLEARGLVRAHERSGFVFHSSASRIEEKKQALLGPGGSRRALIGHILSSYGKDAFFDLIQLIPAPQLLPADELAHLMASAVRDDPQTAADHPGLLGHEELRRRIAYRATASGIRASADDVIVTSGALDATRLALCTLASPGDEVLIQSPAFHRLLQLLEELGITAREFIADPRDGATWEAIERTLGGSSPKACILMPNFADPDGSLMRIEERRRVVEELTKRNIPIVEDDVSGELSFDGVHPGTLAALDRTGSVILCSSFSGSIAPGYRVGWMIPGRFLETVLETKAATNAFSSTPTQMAIAAFLGSRRYAAHLNRLRVALRAQSERVVDEVTASFPSGTRCFPPRGGLALWVELPRDVDSFALFLKALEEGIGILPGMLFADRDLGGEFIRIACRGVWDDGVRDAIRHLGAIAASDSSRKALP